MSTVEIFILGLIKFQMAVRLSLEWQIFETTTYNTFKPFHLEYLRASPTLYVQLNNLNEAQQLKLFACSR